MMVWFPGPIWWFDFQAQDDGLISRPNMMVRFPGPRWWFDFQTQDDGSISRPKMMGRFPGPRWWFDFQAQDDGLMILINVGLNLKDRVSFNASKNRILWECCLKGPLFHCSLLDEKCYLCCHLGKEIHWLAKKIML